MDTDPTLKQAFKEAIKEWLDGQAEKVGYWSMKMILYLGLVALAYFILQLNGWKHFP
jgi:hypothetical protein